MTLLSSLVALTNKGPAYVSRTGGSLGPVGLPAGGNVEAQMRAYATVGVLFAIVSRLSEAVASATWALYKVGDDKPIINHPAAKLWEKPNDFMDQDTFIETAMQHFELAGETDWVVSRSTATSITMPLELWPVRPDRIAPVPHPDKFIEGWVYQAPGGKAEPYRVDEVIQMKRPNPLDPYRGLAPVAAAMVDVWGERAAAEYNAMFFKNSAEPGGVITFPERMSDEDYNAFVARWREQHLGVANAHRVAVLEGATWSERKYTMRDMQFEELRKLNREFIRQAFGYPKSMLGDTEDVNKASAIAGEYVFVRWMVRPRLERMQATLNTRLLPMFGSSASGLEFRFTTPVPADKELEIADRDSLYENVGALIRAGFEPEGSLAALGLPPITHLGLPPVTVQSAEDAGGAPDAPADDAAPSPRRGRPTTANDADARAIWEQAQQHWRERPMATFEAVAGLVGVSERTLRRYRDVF